VAAGVGWVEVDARITADGVLVARHDPIAADGRFISTLSSAETDELGLMRVGDLLEDLPPEIGVDVDIKTSLEDATRPRDRHTAALVADLVTSVGPARPLFASSFDPAAVLIFRERAPEAGSGLITWMRFPLRKAIPAAVHLGVDVLAAHFGSFFPKDPAMEHPSERSVAAAHEAGLQVAAWCPPPPEAAALMEVGVDCIVVDDVPSKVGVRTGTG
jgi:glycerophosphoryl diester phosphodiesterase